MARADDHAALDQARAAVGDRYGSATNVFYRATNRRTTVIRG
jgi:hypothetical protein